MLEINPKSESQRIITFIRQTLKREGFSRLVLGLSGGVDSAAAAFLATEAIGVDNLYIILLPCQNQDLTSAETVIKQLEIPQKNVVKIDITKFVEAVKQKTIIVPLFHCSIANILKGNLLARLRMIFLFDAAKRLNALVCGTENRSEHLLGYFTRFGDEASDIEPLIHLYKTQVYQLAEYLDIPDQIIKSQPTAGLWPGQTDEKELGFSYAEADEILHLYFDKKMKPEAIGIKCGRELTRKVLKRVKENLFKHETPYSLRVKS